MKTHNLIARYLLVGLCLFSIPILSFAGEEGGIRISSLDELKNAMQSTLKADGDVQDLYIEQDLLVDEVIPVTNTTPFRMYGHSLIRAEGYSGNIITLANGTDLTLESNIDGNNVVSHVPEIVIDNRATFRMNGSTISNIVHSKALMGIIENAGTMYMSSGSMGEYKSTEMLFDIVPYCLRNYGTLVLQAGTISSRIWNEGKIIINQSAAAPGKFKSIHCEGKPIEIASPIYTEIELGKGQPLLANTGFSNGDIIANGTSSYSITEADRKKLIFSATNIVTELDNNQIRIKSGGNGGTIIVNPTTDLQGQVDAATGTATSPTIITIPEAGITLPEPVIINNKHVKITGGTIKADFSKTQWLTMFQLESGSLTLENITLDGARADNVSTPIERSCTFIRQKGGECHLNNGAKLTNAAGHHDRLNNVLIEKGTCYAHKGSSIIDNRCLMGGAVMVDKGANFIVDGGYIMGNDESTNAYWAGAVYVSGRMDFSSGDISHHQHPSIGIVGEVYYGNTFSTYCFTESIRMYKGGTLYLISSIGNVSVSLDDQVKTGEVLVRGYNYQLTEKDRDGFKMPEGYGLKLQDNTLILTQGESTDNIGSLEELIIAISNAPAGTIDKPTEIVVNGTINVDHMITVKGKHIKLTGENLVFMNTATGNSRFFSVEGGGSLHIENAVLDGNKEKTGKYCSLAYVSANSTLNMMKVTMQNVWSDSKTWTMLRIEGKSNILLSNIKNNSGTGLIYIGANGNCLLGGEVNIQNNICAEEGYVYSLIINEGNLFYEAGQYINNHAISLSNQGYTTLSAVNIQNYLTELDKEGGSALLLYGSLKIVGTNIKDAIYMERTNQSQGCILLDYQLQHPVQLVCQKPQDGWVIVKPIGSYKLTQSDLQQLVLSSSLAKEYTLELVSNTIVLKALKGKEYKVSVETCKNGKLTADKASAAEGEQITVTVTPDKGYKLYTEEFFYNRFYRLQASSGNTNIFTFKMPKTDAHVTAEFIPEKVTITPVDPSLFNPDTDIIPGTGIGNLDSLIARVGGEPDIKPEAKPVPDKELPGELKDAIEDGTKKGDNHIGSLEELITIVSEGVESVYYTTPCKVRLTFYLPKAKLRALTKDGYYILNESEGKITRIIPEYNPENNTLVFETDKLGVFAVLQSNSSSTANEVISMDSATVWSEGNTLHVYTADRQTIRIYTIEGRLYKASTGSGEHSFSAMPRGHYIVMVGNSTYKVAFR